MIQIYSYIRVSGQGQVDGDGPERQRDAIAAFCCVNHLLHMGEFFEKGVSGTVEGMDRPEFSDMLERVAHLATNGLHIAAIVVERADRLARDLLVSELLLSECRKRGIQVFASDRGLVDIATNEGDPTHKLIRQVIAAVAEFEKSCLVRKLKIARDRMKAKTGRCEGGKPYGTSPNEPELLLYIKSLCDQPDPPSYEQMARSLNTAGLFNRKGHPWTKSCIHSLVQRVAKRDAWALPPREPGRGQFRPQP